MQKLKEHGTNPQYQTNEEEIRLYLRKNSDSKDDPKS